jgi:hypothetical protein
MDSGTSQTLVGVRSRTRRRPRIQANGVREYWSNASYPKRQSIPDPWQDSLLSPPNRKPVCNRRISDIAGSKILRLISPWTVTSEEL